MAPRQRSSATQRTRAHTGRKRRRDVDHGAKGLDEENEVLSSEEDEELAERSGADRAGEEEVEEEETADAKRLRIAKAYLDRVKAAAFSEKRPEGNGLQDGEGPEGERDTLVAHRLMQEQREESGKALRFIAARVQVGEPRVVGRRHRQSVTAIALTGDDSQAFSASKDGMVAHWNVETGVSSVLEWPAAVPIKGTQSGGKQGKKRLQSRHVLALAVSSDGHYLAAGGLDRQVHIWDMRTHKHVQAFAGHRGAVAGLAFRTGTHQLFSGSYDRSLKIWSVDDLAYMDSLYGHQSEVVALDCLRTERVLSAGRDRTCRIWKVPEETQLVLRGHSSSIDCCALITPNDFVSGSEDGSLALWSALRKKPVHIVRAAHGVVKDAMANGVTDHNHEAGDAEERGEQATGEHLSNGLQAGSMPYVGVGGAAQGWVGAVAVCRGTDLAASGAADGRVRLWRCDIAGHSLQPLHSSPTNGFVNSLAFANSGRFLLAGTGQEPRLGRWGRMGGVRNGVMLHPLELS